MDHIAVMKPITKWAGACYETERIPEYIETAIRHAVSGIPGPAYLELPMDILMNEARWEVSIPPISTMPPRVGPDRQAALEALLLLRQSQRPMMMVGTSVKWSHAQAELLAFLAATDIPAYANGMGRGMIPHDSKHFFSATRKEAMEGADCVILAGSILDFRLAFGQTIPKEAKIIQLDMDNTLIGHNRHADVGLVGNLAVTFNMLLEVMAAEKIALDFSGYAEGLRAKERKKAEQAKAAAKNDQVPIHHTRFCQEVADFVNDDMIVIGDGGDIVANTAKVLPVPKNGFWLDPGPLGTLGVGMPFALAAQLAHPDKRVLVVFGDGSFGLNGFEYDTAVRFDLPIVGIVGNDAAWGQMMRPQLALYGQLCATQLNYTRYDKVVEALGGHGEHVTRPEEIRPALERAFASGKPACINVELEQDQSYRGGSYV
jgi:acetolactate synthase-1/2/3 large subunit